MNLRGRDYFGGLNGTPILQTPLEKVGMRSPVHFPMGSAVGGAAWSPQSTISGPEASLSNLKKDELKIKGRMLTVQRITLLSIGHLRFRLD